MSSTGFATGSWSRPIEFLPRSVVIVAPTSRSACQASFRPPVEVEGVPTLVLIEQLGAVDVQRLGKRAGRLDVEEMSMIPDEFSSRS